MIASGGELVRSIVSRITDASTPFEGEDSETWVADGEL